MQTDWLQELNEEQRAAVTATEGYVRVLAGPGTGKTKCLTYRYAYLVRALGISAQSILCITFTNKAAEEMKLRLRTLCGGYGIPLVTTFHGFCAEFLRDHADKAGLATNFTILDVTDVKDLLKPIYKGLNINGRNCSLQDGWDYIDARKSLDLTYVDDLLCEHTESLRQKALSEADVMRAMFYLYLYQQRVCHALDYDDLIALTLHVLKSHQQIRTMWQERLEYILVDEYQDIDRLQNEICEILAQRQHNLFIVGDPDQTIYSFRGADVSFFTDFVRLHQPVSCFYLKKNYRSQAPILDCAYTLISHNQDPGRVRLQSEVPPLKQSELVGIIDKTGEELSDPAGVLQGNPQSDRGLKLISSAKPLLAYLPSSEAEAEYVCLQLKQIAKAHPQASCAILYRAHHLSRVLEKALLLHKIPYRIINDLGFFEFREIKDLLAYLRLCVNPRDDAAFRRVCNVPPRGFGQKRQQILGDSAASCGQSIFEALGRLLKEQPELFRGTRMRDFYAGVASCSQQVPHLLPSRSMELILDTFDYERQLKLAGEKERLENIASFKQLCFDYETRAGERTLLKDFVGDLALDYVRERQPEQQNTVRLFTVHNAKGLEFDYVFIVGLCEGIFPSFKSTRLQELEEERRLLYVAMTRARRQLFMTVPQGVNRQGRERQASRFVEDFRAEELLQLGGHSVGLHAEPVAAGQAKFAVSQRVFHEIMGVGTILEVRVQHGEYVVKFEGLSTPRTLSFSAPLREL